jgi:hypothetical protein
MTVAAGGYDGHGDGDQRGVAISLLPGARLHSSRFHIVAFEFDLSFDDFKTTKHCHVVWRDGNTCGV